MSTLAYDYETGKLEFALPKHGQAILKDGSCLLLLTNESPSMLQPSRPLAEADMRTVALAATRKTKEEPNEKRFDEEHEQILVVCFGDTIPDFSLKRWTFLQQCTNKC